MQDGHNRINLNEAAASALAQRPTGYMDYQGTNMRGQVERKWALGLQVAFAVPYFIYLFILLKYICLFAFGCNMHVYIRTLVS